MKLLDRPQTQLEKSRSRIDRSSVSPAKASMHRFHPVPSLAPMANRHPSIASSLLSEEVQLPSPTAPLSPDSKVVLFHSVVMPRTQRGGQEKQTAGSIGRTDFFSAPQSPPPDKKFHTPSQSRHSSISSSHHNHPLQKHSTLPETGLENAQDTLSDMQPVNTI